VLRLGNSSATTHAEEQRVAFARQHAMGLNPAIQFKAAAVGEFEFAPAYVHTVLGRVKLDVAGRLRQQTKFRIIKVLSQQNSATNQKFIESAQH
jgi:hypothetical protein